MITAYNEIRSEDKDRLNKFLPNTVNNIQFILEIERIANLHNMPIKDIKFETQKSGSANPNIVTSKTEDDDNPYGTFPVSFVTEGSYDSFVSFLKDLEYNLRLVDIKAVSFSITDPTANVTKGLDVNSQDVYRYTVAVETYWLK